MVTPSATKAPWYLPYPAAGVKPDLPAGLRSLAYQLERTIGKTQSYTLKLRPGLVSGHVYLKRVGCQVSLDWALWKKTATAGKQVWVTTLPLALCPQHDLTGASTAEGSKIYGVLPPSTKPPVPSYYDTGSVTKARWDALVKAGWKPLPSDPDRIYRPVTLGGPSYYDRAQVSAAIWSLLLAQGWTGKSNDNKERLYKPAKPIGPSYHDAVSTADATWNILVSQGWKPKPVNYNRIYWPGGVTTVTGHGYVPNNAVRFYVQRSTGHLLLQALRNTGTVYLTGHVSWIVPFEGPH